MRRLLSAWCCLLAGIASAADPGRTEWIGIPAGRLKVHVYTAAKLTGHPLLVLVLHGDYARPPPSYHYEFARRVASELEDVVAAGVLRPGYTDPSGDRSSGVLGDWAGDNYTSEIVDAVARAAEQLRNESAARAVFLVGHSGGAAIAADVIGRHPGLAQGALLVSCPCDVPAWRAYMKSQRPASQASIWEGPVPSLSPVALAAAVSPATRVRLVVGAADDVAPPRFSEEYRDALSQHGIDVALEIEPGLTHDMLLEPVVMRQLEQLLSQGAH
jgi:predicted esterase